MPGRLPGAASLSVSITQSTLIRRKEQSETQQARYSHNRRITPTKKFQRHNERQGNTQERRRKVTQSLARHQVKSSRSVRDFILDPDYPGPDNGRPTRTNLMTPKPRPPRTPVTSTQSGPYSRPLGPTAQSPGSRHSQGQRHPPESRAH